MAVTYSWRLDSDKYAYIVPPVEELAEVSSGTSLIYGYLSKVPLSGDLAHQVATRAEELFGKDSDGGLDKYIEAFSAMEKKIGVASTGIYTQKLFDGSVEEEFEWPNATHFDLVSADVYYNIDAATCADLRGVGISGIRYIGSISGKTYVDYSNPDGDNTTIVTLLSKYYGQENYDEGNDFGVDVNNAEWIPAGTPIKVEYLMQEKEGEEAVIVEKDVILGPGIPGYTDLYGIYLSDTEADGEGNLTPEHTFAVRNGKDAGYVHVNVNLTSSVGTEIEKLQGQIAKLENSLEAALETINALRAWVTTAETRIKELETFKENSGGGSSNTEIAALYNEIERVNGRVDILEDNVNSIVNTGGGGGTVGSNIKVITMSVDDSKKEERVNIGGTDLSFSPNDNLYVLGTYLPEGTIFDGEARGATNVDYLFAVPYVKLSKNGIVIDADVETTNKHAFYQGDENTETKDGNFKTLANASGYNN